MKKTIAAGVFFLLAGRSWAQAPMPTVNDPGVITTHQMVTPAGVQSVFSGRVHAVSFCDADTLAVAVSGGGFQVALLSVGRNRMVAETQQPTNSVGIQGAFCVGEGGSLLTTGTARRNSTVMQTVQVFPLADILSLKDAKEPVALPTPGVIDATPGAGSIGGISATPSGKTAAVALTGSNEIAVVDLSKQRILHKAQVGIAPFTTVIHPDGSVAWASNWGGRMAKPGELTATTGSGQREDKVVIDPRGIAAAGTISRIDLQSGKVTDEVAVGLHPTALAWDTNANRLYVANGNSDSVSVIDSNARRVVATWPVQPFSRPVAGIAPTAMVLSGDRKRLYVTCGGINAVAVIDAASGDIKGLIPTGWYPAHIAISPKGDMLAVSTLLGIGSGSELNASVLSYFREELPNFNPGTNRRYVHSYRGTVHLIPVPEPDQLTGYTRAVAENTHLSLQAESSARKANHPPTTLPVPARSGDPSLIKHAVYIVKENRTYDQLFGDLGKGNGDPSLVIYGEDVSPNHHALARQFVVLDNFYATGGNSGDGHQWVTQAAETDYAMWPGYSGRSYPFDGNDPIAYARSGFLWDAALAAGKTFADFGEFIPSGQYRETESDKNYPAGKLRSRLLDEWRDGSQFESRFNVKSPIPVLDAHLVRDYPSYGGTAPDVVRSRIFLRHLRKWEQEGSMPNLVYIQLASDHTSGTSPGWHTPKACVADNDLALGEIVDGLTHSKFWPDMAIYVVEDDAQGGVDHVDGHRTVALAISPYIRRQAVDSTFYSQPSISRTIELQLGLSHMSLFDLIANDMRNSFGVKADLTPYNVIKPKQSLFELNPPTVGLTGEARKDAIASSRMDWSKPDAAPARKLFEILWRNAKGYASSVPRQENAVFLPFAPPERDDEDDKQERGVRR